MGRPRRGRAVIPAILAGTALMVRPPAAHPQVCVTVTLYQAGQPTTRSHCQSLLDEYPTDCVEDGHTIGGNGASFVVCVPEGPVVQDQYSSS